MISASRRTDGFDPCSRLLLPARVDQSDQHWDFFCAYFSRLNIHRDMIDLCANAHQQPKKIVHKTNILTFGCLPKFEIEEGLRITAQKEVWCQFITNQQTRFYCTQEIVSVLSSNQQGYDQGKRRNQNISERLLFHPFGNSRNFFATMNPRLALSFLQLGTFVVAVLSSASPSSPSPLLSKSIVGGSLKPPAEETSTLFGVTRKNVAPEDEAIFVIKRDGSKEPLEKKKVGRFN